MNDDYVHVSDIDDAVAVIEEEADTHGLMADEAPKGTLEHAKRREKAKGLRTAIAILEDHGVY